MFKILDYSEERGRTGTRIFDPAGARFSSIPLEKENEEVFFKKEKSKSSQKIIKKILSQIKESGKEIDHQKPWKTISESLKGIPHTYPSYKGIVEQENTQNIIFVGFIGKVRSEKLGELCAESFPYLKKMHNHFYLDDYENMMNEYYGNLSDEEAQEKGVLKALNLSARRFFDSIEKTNSIRTVEVDKESCIMNWNRFKEKTKFQKAVKIFFLKVLQTDWDSHRDVFEKNTDLNEYFPSLYWAPDENSEEIESYYQAETISWEIEVSFLKGKAYIPEEAESKISKSINVLNELCLMSKKITQGVYDV